MSAENALAVQSAKHPDGWGVAYYTADVPHVVKNVSKALDDHIFRRVSGVVASQTVVAHVRKATVGDLTILNSHPFQYGRWVFAHNGTIRNFETVRQRFMDLIAPGLRRYILGDTDSEVMFYLFLSNLAQLTDLHRRGTGLDEMVQAMGTTVAQIQELADGSEPEQRSSVTVLVTDGHALLGSCLGRTLHYSTYKTHCLDRTTCPHLAPECEAPTASGFVNHLIVSSEPLQGDNIWIPMNDGEVVGVDWRMRLYRGTLPREAIKPAPSVLPVVSESNGAP